LLAAVVVAAQVTTVVVVVALVVCYISQLFLLALDPTQLQLAMAVHKTPGGRTQLDLVTLLLEVVIG
jgi:hypothetical protein